MAYGMRSSIGFVHENSLDTLAGARTDFIEALSESVAENFDRFEVANVYGGLYERPDVGGLKRVEGDLVFAANPETVGHAFAGALGVSSTVEVTSGLLYQHTFTARANDLEVLRPLDTYSFEIFRDVTSAHIYTGMSWSKLSLNWQPNQAMQVTASMLGITAAVGSASTPTYPGSPTNPFAFDTTSLSLGGAASGIFEALTIEYDNQLELVPAINNSIFPRKAGRTGPYMVRVSGTLTFEDLTEYNNFTNQTEARLLVHCFKASSFGMTIDIPSMMYTAFPVAAGGRERITVGFEGQGRYNSGSASTIKVDLWNTRSGYVLADNGL